MIDKVDIDEFVKWVGSDGDAFPEQVWTWAGSEEWMEDNGIVRWVTKMEMLRRVVTNILKQTGTMGFDNTLKNILFAHTRRSGCHNIRDKAFICKSRRNKVTSKCVSNVTLEKSGGMSIETLDISDRMKNMLINSDIIRTDQLAVPDKNVMSCHGWFHSKVRRSELEGAVQKARALLLEQNMTRCSTE